MKNLWGREGEGQVQLMPHINAGLHVGLTFLRCDGFVVGPVVGIANRLHERL